MNLFDTIRKENAPLAERMRASNLVDFVGQDHIVGQGSLMRRAIKADRLGSCIFYGPPGTGKTTLANIIANTTNAHFEQLNAVSSGVADAKRIIAESKNRLELYGKKTYLLLDECHRWNKAQSDSVLAGIEQGSIVFVGSTTENPYISMTRAIVSRCRIFEFHKLDAQDILKSINRAINDKVVGLGNYTLDIEDGAIEHIATVASGDLRNALNAIEIAVITTDPDTNGVIHLTKEIASQSIGRRVLSLDESSYYDMLSAFCKSLRGSDSNASLYWAERMLSAGVDPLIIARRLIVHSAEDVGLADPIALHLATSSLQALEKIGMPEAKIPLYEAIIYVAEAEKSNSVIVALHAVEQAVKNIKVESVPLHLQDVNFKVEKVSGYKYPHDYNGYVKQQYLPDELVNAVFYEPKTNGFENIIIERKKGRV